MFKQINLSPQYVAILRNLPHRLSRVCSPVWSFPCPPEPIEEPMITYHGQLKLPLYYDLLFLTKRTKALAQSICIAYSLGSYDLVEKLIEGEVCLIKSGNLKNKGTPGLEKGNELNGIIKLIQAKGKKLDVEDDLGRTPLFSAVLVGYKAGVKAFLKAGVDQNKSDIHGITPVHAAISTNIPSKRQVQILRILLDAKSNPEATTKSGLTPLMVAAFEGKTEMIKLLIARGATVDRKDLRGLTSLHYCMLSPNSSTVVRCARTLLENGSLPDSRDHKLCTPLQLLAHNYNLCSSGHELDKLIRDYGADPKPRDRMARTIRHHVKGVSWSPTMPWTI